MRRPVCGAIALLLALGLCGCEEETEDLDDGGPVVMDAGPGGPICVCPGFAGRPFGSCAKPPFDGDLQISFTCDPRSAIFTNNTCHFQINSSNFLALLLLPGDVFVPISPPERPFPVVFNTMANDPPGGIVTLTGTDLATGQSFPIGDVVVSNNCP
jgi:hypothetical protein